MKLLFDENLSRKLVARLSDLFPGSIHAAEAGLMSSPDTEVWAYAGRNGFIVTTADSDFHDMAVTLGPPPKVIWLHRWTHPTADAERVLRREAIRIAHFAADQDQGVLVLAAGFIARNG